jgi:hypothetical protein
VIDFTGVVKRLTHVFAALEKLSLTTDGEAKVFDLSRSKV